MVDKEDDLDEDLTYPAEDVEKHVQDTAEEILKDATWDEVKVPQWINQICETLMKRLLTLRKPYKFIVTCVLQ